MSINYLSTIRLPRVAALPGTASTGDCVVLDDGSYLDGIAHVYNGTSWIPLGLYSELPGGVLSTDLGDSYATASTVAGGANDFVVVAIVSFMNTRDGSKIEPIWGAHTNASSGWWLSSSYNQIQGNVVVDGNGLVSVAVSPSYVDPNRRMGELLAIGFRVWGAGVASTANLDIWVGPVSHGFATAPSVGEVIPETTAPLEVLTGTFFTDESAFNGIFFGGGYYEGTVTDDEMRAIMGHAQVRGEIPETLLAWDLVYQGRDGKTAPTTWSPSVGTGDLTKSGTPTAIADEYWPGGGAANNVLIAGSGAAPTGSSGTNTVNFGTLPGGDTTATITVSGQTGIQSTSKVTAWVQATSTADHSIDEHWVEELQVVAGNIVPTSGFTIYVKCNRRTYGQWTIGWKWE